jgi:phosphoenolpyruvate carboxylase
MWDVEGKDHVLGEDLRLTLRVRAARKELAARAGKDAELASRVRAGIG